MGTWQKNDSTIDCEHATALSAAHTLLPHLTFDRAYT
jgi:hypothetical protein